MTGLTVVNSLAQVCCLCLYMLPVWTPTNAVEASVGVPANSMRYR
ncbi:hypothetical protein ACFU8T_16180 [Sphingobacterium spiritivorum]|uniref:Uncharacterized protein n=1 Tax=Sphingobacterium spiritivorum ATCC 33861 TaxID=525373 RepID=D7VM36_SPHSI|nr:hypothetical protein [Sphingobacterium spiritivorum]EFK58041.1 hypothetical protein HMPREF0766_12033 [Sphingobacterium spiritivorum ATCC 33861]